MKIAAEVMNRNFFHATLADPIGNVLHTMGERGLGTVPVLDLGGRPLGIATVGELEVCYDMEELVDRLARPALSVPESTPVDVAARTLALHESETLLLVDSRGVATGALSALELLRALLGLEALEAAPLGAERDVCWEDAEVLEVGAAHRAPPAPGIILLSPGLDAGGRRIVWSEAAPDMRERLDQMLRVPQDDPMLERLLDVYPRAVRFRCLTVYDPDQRKELATALSTRPPPAEPHRSGGQSPAVAASA